MKLGLVIGRFAPLHEGHKLLIRQAAAGCDKLLVLVGSANQPRTIRTPWTYQERAAAIKNWADFPANIDIVGKKIKTVPINDYAYNDSVWIKQIQQIVGAESYLQKVSNTDTKYFGLEPKVILFGHEKEDTEYLSWFPDWKYVSVKSEVKTSGTSEREFLFKNKPETLPRSVVDDWNYFKKEEELFKNYPFPETLNFNCADAILECAGHVLMIKRKSAPGAGTWALPGGFKNRNETFVDCSIRELVEETNVRIPEKVLRGSIKSTKLFDAINRGNGIPRNTLAVHIKVELDADGELPRVSPADDAVEAKWIKLSEIGKNVLCFDKHDSIMINMGVL